MLKHLKLVSGLMFVLGLLLTLQCVSGGVFFTALEGNRAVRNTLIDHEHAQTTLDASWSALLQTRISLSRAGTRLVKANTDHVAAADLSPILDDARRTLGNAGRSFASFNNQPALEMPDGDTALSALQDSFQQYHLALQALINYLQDKDVSPFLAQPTQSLQDNFETAYDSYKQHAAKVIAANLRAGNARYRTSLWALGIAIALMVVAILLVWRAATAMFIRPLKKITHHIHLLANGDLTASLDIDSHNEIGMLASQLRRMQAALEEIVTSVREGANAIHAGTHEGSVRNQDLSSRTEQQAAALEETAASMDQITAMARQNAANAEQARQLATETSSSATESGVLVGDVIATMKQIATSAQKMANIIGVVDNIAFQTNMLALNAAVEAARAGEHGRGFAIVAGEVRNLAQSSAQAAKEIKQLIDDSGTQIDAGASQVRVANDRIEGVITAVGRVNTIISDIALASDEQSRGIDQVNTAVVEMDNVTQQNASLVEESAASSKILEEQAQALNDAVSVFKVKH